jgi:hypothetical protein
MGHLVLRIEIGIFDRTSMSCRHVEMLVVVKLVILDLDRCILVLVMIGPIARSGRRDWRLAFLVFLFVPLWVCCRLTEQRGRRLDGARREVRLHILGIGQSSGHKAKSLHDYLEE